VTTKLVHDVGRDPAAIFAMMSSLGPADQDILAREDFRQAFTSNVAEAFRQGSRGPAHDYTLEARPWGVPLGQIRVPVEIWHGQDDRLVSPQQSQILAAAVPGATTHLVPGQGHLLLAGDHAQDALQSALSS
jgi:pimeloyl-ACP methyl ester carboxylesterase